jgi:hypothetical protein
MGWLFGGLGMHELLPLSPNRQPSHSTGHRPATQRPTVSGFRNTGA